VRLTFLLAEVVAVRARSFGTEVPQDDAGVVDFFDSSQERRIRAVPNDQNDRQGHRSLRLEHCLQ
jgi:hypothetical protein